MYIPFLSIAHQCICSALKKGFFIKQLIHPSNLFLESLPLLCGISRYSKSFKNIVIVLYLNPDQDAWNKEAWQLAIKDFQEKMRKRQKNEKNNTLI